jgi:oxalate decarboxylase/phosphoglucose isomerase-like protein (cupin superfamily)
VVRVPPEAAHAVTNKGSAPLRLVRIETKNGFPKQP